MVSKISKKQDRLASVVAVMFIVIVVIAVAFCLIDPYGWFDGDVGNGDENGCVPATVENGRFDVNSDGKVDLVDMVALGDQYTISPYNNEYDVTYDLNCDQVVDETDMQLLADIVYG